MKIVGGNPCSIPPGCDENGKPIDVVAVTKKMKKMKKKKNHKHQKSSKK